MSNGICSLTATDLAARIARGEISALEAVDAHIDRVERVNDRLNAIVVKRYDAARAEARAADERRRHGDALPPLHGLPITIKECLDLEGTPSTFGVPSLAHQIVAQDEPHVARLRSAGAIVLGKTNAGQLLLMLETSNPVYGRTNNPWNLERSAGGSSGGEGAIIAAHGSPLGFGTDLGGSCRVPAAFCGIAGFKPTQGRADDPGRFSVPFGQRAIASQIGVLARAVDDISLGLRVMTGGPTTSMRTAIGDPRAVDIGKLRIGVYDDDGVFAASPAAKRAVRETSQTLSAAGAKMVPFSPPEISHVMDLFLGILSADRFAGIMEFMKGQPFDPIIAPMAFMGRQSAGALRLIRGMLRFAGQKGLADNIRAFGHADTRHYWQLVEQLCDYRARFREMLEHHPDGPIHAIVCPQVALPAFVHGACRDLALAGSYSLLANVLGYPAGTVPWTRVQNNEEMGARRPAGGVRAAASKTEKASQGLPIGVQVIARPWREDVALAVMQTIETTARKRADYPVEPPIV